MKYNLLIVDDEENNLELIKAIFRKEEMFVLHFAEDINDVLEILKKITPDLILLDIQLPILNGYEVLAKLIENNVKTRVIMNSAYFTDIDTAIKCVKNGACDYIRKPFNHKDLIERVKRAVILDSAYNMSILHTPTIKSLVVESEKMRKEYKELNSKNWELQTRINKLKNKEVFHLVFVKIFYAMISFLITFFAFKYNVVQGKSYSLILFLMTFLLLLVPANKIKEFRTKLFKLIVK